MTKTEQKKGKKRKNFNLSEEEKADIKARSAIAKSEVRGSTRGTRPKQS